MGDLLVSATVTCADDTLTIATPTIVGTVVTALISAGNDGTSYQVNCEVATAASYIANAVDTLNVLDAAR